MPCQRCRHHQHLRLLHQQRRLLRPRSQKAPHGRRVGLMPCQLQTAAITTKGSVLLSGIRLVLVQHILIVQVLLTRHIVMSGKQ